MLAVIGGSGFYELGTEKEKERVITPYGDAEVSFIKLNKNELLFIPRHGKNHVIPPHKVNYRANVYALKKLGAKAALGSYAAGIISKYKPKDLIILDDLICGGCHTYFDDFSDKVTHVDMSEPYDKKLQKLIIEAAGIHDIKMKKGGIIVSTSGPRFETKAEIKMFKKLGANLVNMTSGPETVLMREIEIPFAGISTGTNYAAGISKKKLTAEEVFDCMKISKNRINLIVEELTKFIE